MRRKNSSATEKALSASQQRRRGRGYIVRQRSKNFRCGAMHLDALAEAALAFGGRYFRSANRPFLSPVHL